MDSLCVEHNLSGAVSTWPPGQRAAVVDRQTRLYFRLADGSGYTMTVSASGISTIFPYRAFLIDRELRLALRWVHDAGSGSFTDTNGNQISVSSSGGQTVRSTDTSKCELTPLTVSGSATASSPLVFSYPNPPGSSSSYTVNYTNYSVQTNFGCSGVTEYASSSQPLISSISLPDGTFLSIHL